MKLGCALGGCAALLVFPAVAAAGEAANLDLPIWSVAPFVLLLLTIAVLPLAASHWWHSNVNRAIVAAGFAVPVVAYLVYVKLATGQDTLHPLLHELENYASFIALLGSLYVVSGGIVVGGHFEAKPLTNTAFLAAGAVLANLIGTTGASVLLIRPLLRINRQRQYTRHIPVFFLFTVSNLGGLLTPLGDPPLFLGFLNGVPFFWTLRLWPQWLLANGLVLLAFFVWESIAHRRELVPAGTANVPPDAGLHAPAKKALHILGLVNLLFLGGIIFAILLQRLLPTHGTWVSALVMAAMALLSLGLTPRHLRQANGFTWGPILEVAILFLAIFVTMVPALEILAVRGKDFGVTEPWQYFWLTGGLSAFLDNAPTYLTFATLAAGAGDFQALAAGDARQVLQLEAISCGAVFMGALTYIGNGPNFMVKAIAEEAGLRMPSFFGYLLFSCVVLLPLFGLVTVIFFAGG